MKSYILCDTTDISGSKISQYYRSKLKWIFGLAKILQCTIKKISSNLKFEILRKIKLFFFKNIYLFLVCTFYNVLRLDSYFFQMKRIYFYFFIIHLYEPNGIFWYLVCVKNESFLKNGKITDEKKIVLI